MDTTTINTLLALIPNLSIAVWCLFRQQIMIDALLEHQQALLKHQQTLIDQLMLMCASEAISKP